MRKAVVVGGGIGGLATAAALVRHGWRVEVLERAPEFAEVGAGISVWPNALRALDALGLGDAVRERSVLSGQAGFKDSDGRWLSRVDTAEVQARFGPMVMLHRAELLDVLRAAVPPEALRSGIEVQRVRADGTVVHSAGESGADLIVGADGIRSAVRTSVWGGSPAPRYAGYAAWRMITAPVEIEDSGESWGRGERFGFASLPDGRVYCFAVANAPEGAARTGLAELERRFGSWHEPIPALLAATSEDSVLHHDLYEMPPLRTYVAGRVALVGDAAHAMTPNLGQGACQALEDAVVLAETATGADLSAYDRERRPRTQQIAKRSRQIGAIAQWSSRPAVALRNAALRLAPNSASLRSLEPVLDWHR
ncbi:2-polyprenyl-6-methoxyphenol hydroxylase [Saccharopolyspora kobensis]|uniref:2-polyprenyl-6-methoxyphenol hydroxylase n=1 Tax=Saccharopolyspora kobensis TaxID=146035 RepID=A0A1H6DC87_9PSEU|nr:FAD-dependent monooxygenase [Saccharopolyspora kobensis]SEG83087.1 2-polyprenyl-6-methoxyphenol hydroxylase [Saccharopolyspora kobensis]SFE28309.1 2-polyprenyl-6-methoxyphenol hydroxylase [Saccharopolyspora kobensis]